jgi:sugar lactone lactonase YvrE
MNADPGYSSYPLRVASDDRDQLGEGPVWDDQRNLLLRVDILKGRILELQNSGASRIAFELPCDVSAAVPRVGGGLVVAAGHELVALDAQGARETLAIVEDHLEDNRFNDCRCDPQGRLWAGTMSKTRTPDHAGLYRLVPGEPIERVLSPTTLSNGLGWSPSGERMYFIDSTTQRIDAFDFDPSTGLLSERRTFAEVPPDAGLPDGLAVDAAGGVWVCLFGGGHIRRYDSRGRLDESISLPVTNPTCPTFGGPGLRTLFITSARHKLSDARLRIEHLAGAVLALEPGVAGLPANRFAG